MYVHQTYRGPRGGRRLVEYFNDLQAARLDVGADGAVLRIRTAEGRINLSMDLDELQYLVAAFTQPVDLAALGPDLEVQLPTPSEPTTLASQAAPAEEAPASEEQEPESKWDRLLADDPVEPSEVLP